MHVTWKAVYIINTNKWKFFWTAEWLHLRDGVCGFEGWLHTIKYRLWVTWSMLSRWLSTPKHDVTALQWEHDENDLADMWYDCSVEDVDCVVDWGGPHCRQVHLFSVSVFFLFFPQAWKGEAAPQDNRRHAQAWPGPRAGEFCYHWWITFSNWPPVQLDRFLWSLSDRIVCTVSFGP